MSWSSISVSLSFFGGFWAEFCLFARKNKSSTVEETRAMSEKLLNWHHRTTKNIKKNIIMTTCLP